MGWWTLCSPNHFVPWNTLHPNSLCSTHFTLWHTKKVLRNAQIFSSSLLPWAAQTAQTMFQNVVYRAYRYIDQLADQLVLEICHIITHISSDFFSYLESTMPISVKLCMGLVEQKTFAVTWSSPCGMHISIDAIGTLNNAVQMLSTGLDWVKWVFWHNK